MIRAINSPTKGLSVRRRRGRKRARGTRAPMPIPIRPNLRWSLEFVSDTFGASRKFRILAVNDDCTRENLGRIADTSISGAGGAEVERYDPDLRQTRLHC